MSSLITAEAAFSCCALQAGQQQATGSLNEQSPGGGQRAAEKGFADLPTQLLHSAADFLLLLDFNLHFLHLPDSLNHFLVHLQVCIRQLAEQPQATTQTKTKWNSQLPTAECKRLARWQTFNNPNDCSRKPNDCSRKHCSRKPDDCSRKPNDCSRKPNDCCREHCSRRVSLVVAAKRDAG